MVSNQWRPFRSSVALSTAYCVVLASAGSAREPAKRFYPDDPILREPPPRASRDLKTRHVNELYDFLYNSLATPRSEKRVRKGRARAAQDMNTLGDVPDSAWYTNRHALRRMSIEDLRRGPGNNSPPSAKGTWRVVSGKSDGVTPGFVIEDEHDNRYLLKLDSPRHPELTSAAEMIGSKLFYALGYYTPENYIVRFDREKLVLSKDAFWKDSAGIQRRFTQRVLDALLKDQPIGPAGTYRGLASRWIAGELLGPFSYQGTRADDPNDTTPHEDRRALRGLRVFAAWLNHQDVRAVNTMDALVTEGGIPHLKHYLIDFGSILGSNATRSKDPWAGNEYVLEGKSALVQTATVGLFLQKWARAENPRLKGVGLFDARSFDPISWKPTYPNRAFLRMDREDAFWAAKQVAAFTEADIRAIVETGEYSDPRATDWVTRCLIERANKVVKAWLRDLTPLDRFAVVDGQLIFDDLRNGHEDGSRRQYAVSWRMQDSSGGVEILPGAFGPTVPPINNVEGSYMVATVTCVASERCSRPVTVYLRPGQRGWTVVGIDR